VSDYKLIENFADINIDIVLLGFLTLCCHTMAKASPRRMWTMTNLALLPAVPTNLKEVGGKFAPYLTKGRFLHKSVPFWRKAKAHNTHLTSLQTVISQQHIVFYLSGGYPSMH
jgi:hypothetical protein